MAVNALNVQLVNYARFQPFGYAGQTKGKRYSCKDASEQLTVDNTSIFVWACVCLFEKVYVHVCVEITGEF